MMKYNIPDQQQLSRQAREAALQFLYGDKAMDVEQFGVSGAQGGTKVLSRGGGKVLIATKLGTELASGFNVL